MAQILLWYCPKRLQDNIKELDFLPKQVLPRAHKGQTQWNSPLLSTQVPPFTQGFGLQSRSRSKELGNENAIVYLIEILWLASAKIKCFFIIIISKFFFY